MAAYTNSFNITINITPWFNKGFKFTKIQMTEGVGGSLAGGEVDMQHDGSPESLELIHNERCGNIAIEKDGGEIYNFPIFIDRKKFFKNYITLRFYCISTNKFFTELISTEYPDIDTAIDALYPGKIEKRCSTDIPYVTPLFQNCETNLSFCQKLASSYRYKSIFCFGFDRLLIKDFLGTDSHGNKEATLKLSGQTQSHQLDSYSLNYDKMLYHIPKNPWVDNELGTDYSQLVAVNQKTIKYYNDYVIVGTPYYDLWRNYLYNTKRYESNLYVAFRTIDLDIPKFRIGDVVLYKREEDTNVDYPWKRFMAESNELFMSVEGSEYVDAQDKHFSWTTKFKCLEENGVILNESDPT